MLLIFYCRVIIYFSLLALALDFIKSIYWLYEEVVDYQQAHVYKVSHATLLIIIYLFALILGWLITMFHEFHRKMVRENKTTIENLEFKDKVYQSKWDVNPEFNYEQIFGTNRWYDYFPIMPKSAKPFGDGIYFQRGYESEDSDEGEQENQEDSRPPANIGNPSSGPNNSSDNPTSQNATQQQVQRPGGIGSSITRQGDVMTIHNDKGSQYRNLNNIVRSDQPAEDLKFNESQPNITARAPTGSNQDQFPNNQMNTKDYEELKNQFYTNEEQKASAAKLTTQPNKTGKSKYTNDRHGSKVSTSAISKNRGTNRGTNKASKHVAGGVHRSNKRSTASSGTKFGAGYR